MKNLFVFLLMFSIAAVAVSQEKLYNTQFRFSYDQDFLNIRGRGTDKAFTGAMQPEYFYDAASHGSFLDRWLPRAGKGAVNTLSVGLLQLSFTPADLQEEHPIAGDYPYSGALLGRHSLHSYNPGKHYSIQTSISAGVMGPVALSEQIQKSIHHAIGDEIPKGWKNQLPNDILLNVDVALEKQLLALPGHADLIGGIRAEAGSMIVGSSAYVVARFGRMEGYFNGLLSQSGSPRGNDRRWQLYLKVKPSINYVAYNALLEGGIILNKTAEYRAEIEHWVPALDYGLVAVIKNVGLSFTQQWMSSLVKTQPKHEVGNITLYFSW